MTAALLLAARLAFAQMHSPAIAGQTPASAGQPTPRAASDNGGALLITLTPREAGLRGRILVMAAAMRSDGLDDITGQVLKPSGRSVCTFVGMGDSERGCLMLRGCGLDVDC